MKVVILAGGEGTRLRPMTHEIPKALIDVNGKTLTERVMEIFQRQGINEFILSIAYLGNKVRSHFGDGSKHGAAISYVEETIPLGTAGPLIVMQEEGRELDETFFMANGDNLLDIDLRDMLDFHKKNKAVATIALTSVKNPESFGVAVLDRERIVEFIEKPLHPPTTYINSGYYVLEPGVFGVIKGKERAMMEKDVFPVLAREGKLFGYRCQGAWFDTGTPERYEQVKRQWKFA